MLYSRNNVETIELIRYVPKNGFYSQPEEGSIQHDMLRPRSGNPYEKKLYGTYMSKLYVKYRGHILVKYISHICILNVNEVKDI